MNYVLTYFLKPLGGFLEFVHAYAMIYLLISIFGGIITTGGEEFAEGQSIYVRTNGIHTDIIFPTETDLFDWKDFIDTSDYNADNKFSFVGIGWGDKGFFIDTPTWDDLTFTTAFNAVFISSPAAMHVEYMSNAPALTEDCKQVEMDKGKYLDLVGFVMQTFEMKAGKVELIPDKGYWVNDNFYEAKGSYSMFQTCNRWTNQGLKVAGVRTGIYSLFSDDIMRHLD